MPLLMGVLMGFLAFFVVGGLSGVFAWILYPGKRSGRPKAKQFLIVAFLSIMAAILVSYVGQIIGLFQSGQMLEWICVTGASCLAGGLYVSVSK